MLENYLEFARDAFNILLETSAMMGEDVSFVHNGQCSYIKINRTGQYYYMNPIKYEDIAEKNQFYDASDLARKRKRESYNEDTLDNNEIGRRIKQTHRRAIGQ